MVTTSAVNPPKCPHCGNMHETTCPTIKAIEYHPDGTVKRVEFKTPADYALPVYPTAPAPAPLYPSPWSPFYGPTCSSGWQQ